MQIPALVAAGYDVRCLRVPAGNREGWPGLTRAAAALLRGDVPSIVAAGGATVVAESFFAPLALMLAAEAPELVNRLVLVNPAVGAGSSDGSDAAANTAAAFAAAAGAAGAAAVSAATGSPQKNPIPTVPTATLASVAEAAAGLGLLEMAPGAMYDLALELAGALAVERTRVGGGEGVSGAKSSGLKLPGDGLPASAAAWRLSLWRAARLPDRYLHGRGVHSPTSHPNLPRLRHWNPTTCPPKLILTRV